MKFHRIVLGIFVIALVLVYDCIAESLPVYAADDVRIGWLELESEHFLIHYPETREAFARRAIAVAEEAHERLVPLLGWTPAEKTHISVIDNLDEANGWAKTTPRNEIQLYAYPPESGSELMDYEDWIRQLIYHEYTHILHTDNSTSKFHAVLNAILGKFARNNATAPRWYTEGLAVYYETLLSNNGRLRSVLYHLMMRQAALAHAIPALGALSTGLVRWPGASGTYLFGAYFIQDIARQYGRESLTEWNKTYGGEWIPYAMNRTAKQVWGKTFETLYDEWQIRARADALAQITVLRTLGAFTPYERLADPFRHGYVRAVPHQNAISYVQNDGAHGQRIVKRDMETGGETVLAKCWGRCAHRWDESGQKLYFSHVTSRDGYLSRVWLYCLDLTANTITKVPNIERLRAFAVDGTDLYWVDQQADKTALYRRDLSGSDLELLYEGREFEQIESLDVKNHQAAASVFDPESRTFDIVLFKDCGQAGAWCKTKLTNDKSLDMTPFWGDEQSIYYVSDVSGELNLWKLELQTQTAVRLTHLSDGMLNPAIGPENDIYYTTYTARGTTIARIKSEDLKRYDESGVDLSPGTIADDPIDKSVWLNAQITPSRRYKPYQWLWPLTWAPRQSVGADDIRMGISVSGVEFSGHHAYSLYFDYLYQFDAVDYGLTYAWTGLLWNIQLSHGLSQNRASYCPTQMTRRNYDYQTTMGSVAASRTWNGRMSSQSLGLSYLVEYSESRDALTWPRRDPLDFPTLPSLGWTNALILTWSWSNMQRYERSLTNSEGYSLNARVRFEAPWLGASDYSLIASANVNGAWTLPSRWPQSIQGRISGGATYSGDDHRQPFTISSNRGGFRLNQSDVMLHGYADGSIYGRHYLYSHLSWTILMTEPSIGYSTIPVGINRIGLGAFGNWGYAWFDKFDIRASKFDVGTRMYLDYTLGYRETLRMSIAYAYGGAPGGMHTVYLFLEL